MTKNLETIFKNPEEFSKELQGKYSSLAQKGNFFELINLRAQTGVEPQLSDGDIITLYISSLRKYTPNAVQLLEQIREFDKKTHKGKPLVFEGLDFADYTKAVQTGYRRTIADNWHMERKHFEALEKLTGIKVSEKTVNNAINKRIKEQDFLEGSYLKNVEEATGIKSVPNNAIVQEKFRKGLIDKRYGPYFWESLFKLTDIKPEEKLVQQAYRQFVRRKNIYDLTMFIEFTGIVPKERTVHAAYNMIAKRNQFSEKFSELQKLTGIAPKPEIIQQAYSVIVNRKESMWEFFLQSVFQETGVAPSEDLVQKAYETCARESHINIFNELYDTFKVKPSKEARKALKEFLKS